MTPPSKQATPATSPQSSFRSDRVIGTERPSCRSEGGLQFIKRRGFLCSCCRSAGLGLRGAEPRLVRLKRIQGELGVQVCGGNLSGIFVESLEDDSPAKGPDGLQPGDLILEVLNLKVAMNHVGLSEGSFKSLGFGCFTRAACMFFLRLQVKIVFCVARII